MRKGQTNPNRGKGAQAQWLRERTSFAEDSCLIWPFTRLPNGYGTFGFEGRSHYAHRFMCTLINGPAPTTKHQCAHSCGHGKDGCVNPRHLSWKTLGGNMLDKRKHGTKNNAWWGWRGKLTQEQIAEIRATPNRPKLIPDLAARFSVTESNIRHIRAGRTWTRVRPRSFTTAEVLAIRAITDRSDRSIAEEYGASRQAVQRVRAGKTYRY